MRTGRPGLPPEIEKRGREMLAKDIPASQIAQELKVGLTKVYEWKRAMKKEDGR